MKAFLYIYYIFQLVDTEKIYAGNIIILGISLLYLPQLVLALVTTLDSKLSSLTILWNHPSLILLPIFTFFTFSKPHNFCRKDPSDNRVRFSVRYTKINMAISLCSFILFCSVLDLTLLSDSDVDHDLYYCLFSIHFAVSMILTIIFIYFDYIFCCCCRCFLSSKHQIVVHDPNKPDRTFHLVNGEIIEVHEKSEGLRSMFIEMILRDILPS